MNAHVPSTLRLVLIAPAALALTGCFGDNVEVLHQLRAFAGKGALDCGLVLHAGHKARQNACAFGAVSQGTPFYVHYILRAGNTTVNRGLAMSRTHLLVQISDSPDAPGTALPLNYKDRAAAKIQPCATHKLLPDPSVPGQDVLTCAALPAVTLETGH